MDDDCNWHDLVDPPSTRIGMIREDTSVVALTLASHSDPARSEAIDHLDGLSPDVPPHMSRAGGPIARPPNLGPLGARVFRLARVLRAGGPGRVCQQDRGDISPGHVLLVSSRQRRRSRRRAKHNHILLISPNYFPLGLSGTQVKDQTRLIRL
jgi:hypothetical protein